MQNKLKVERGLDRVALLFGCLGVFGAGFVIWLGYSNHGLKVFKDTSFILTFLILLVYGSGLLWACVFYEIQRKRTKKFITWLRDNVEIIRNGNGIYNGIPIKMETELVQYQVAISAIVGCYKFPSTFCFNDDQRKVGKLRDTLISLLLGWWGIPWGPVFVVMALTSNISGGIKSTVSEILENIS